MSDAVTVEPGDTLFISESGNASPASMVELRDLLAKSMPGVTVHVLVGRFGNIAYRPRQNSKATSGRALADAVQQATDALAEVGRLAELLAEVRADFAALFGAIAAAHPRGGKAVHDEFSDDAPVVDMAARVIRHMAKATHGTCAGCGESIMAAERFEASSVPGAIGVPFESIWHSPRCVPAK